MCCGGLVVGRQGCLGRAQPTSGHPLVEMQRCDHTVRHLAILDHRRQAGAQHAPEDVLWPIAPAAGIPDREEKLVLLDARLQVDLKRLRALHCPAPVTSVFRPDPGLQPSARWRAYLWRPRAFANSGSSAMTPLGKRSAIVPNRAPPPPTKTTADRVDAEPSRRSTSRAILPSVSCTAARTAPETS